MSDSVDELMRHTLPTPLLLKSRLADRREFWLLVSACFLVTLSLLS